MAITNTQVALYSTDGTTLSKIAQTAPAASGLWDTATTRFSSSLATPVPVLARNVYYVALLVNAGTAGSHSGRAKASNLPDPTTADVPIPLYTKTSETACAATYAVSALTAAYSPLPWVALEPA